MKTASITPAQLKIIHVMLNKLDLMKEKTSLIYSFSDGRTESSRELFLMEARDLIEYLKEQDNSSAIIRSIWHLAYDMGVIYGKGYEENEMNAAKLDAFCKARGTVKKALCKQSFKELKQTHRQFNAMYRKHVEKETIKVTIEELKRDMQHSIEHEDYEKCSMLQLEINKLQNT